MTREAAVCQTPASDAGVFGEQGFAIFESVISSERCDELATELSAIFQSCQDQTSRKIGGLRNLLHTNSSVAQLAISEEYATVLSRVLGQKPFPVRALFFDKTDENNWSVPWHQDLSIAVAERLEVDGFGGWSVKDGVVHVHPPSEILAGTVAVRLHLDDCGLENGALKVVPSSHLHGKLDSTQESVLMRNFPPVACECRKGGVLLMRPLLLHSSSAARNPSHRRVLQMEYSVRELPGGLKWFGRA